MSNKTQGSWARYITLQLTCFSCFYYYYFFAVLLYERSIFTILLQFEHFISITPEVGVTLSRMRHPQLGHFLTIFTSSVQMFPLEALNGLDVIVAVIVTPPSMEKI